MTIMCCFSDFSGSQKKTGRAGRRAVQKGEIEMGELKRCACTILHIKCPFAKVAKTSLGFVMAKWTL